MDAETDGRSNINFGALRGIVQIISYEVKISLVMISFILPLLTTNIL